MPFTLSISIGSVRSLPVIDSDSNIKLSQPIRTRSPISIKIYPISCINRCLSSHSTRAGCIARLGIVLKRWRRRSKSHSSLLLQAIAESALLVSIERSISAMILVSSYLFSSLEWLLCSIVLTAHSSQSLTNRNSFERNEFLNGQFTTTRSPISPSASQHQQQ